MEENANAYIYLKKLCDDLKNHNRFFTDEKFNYYLRRILEDTKKTIKPHTVFYRARNFQDKEVKQENLGTQFEGFNAKESFVNVESKWPSQGRMNPQGIYALYVATDEKTAIKELHPYFEGIYSVATIENTEELLIADLSQSFAWADNKFLADLSLLIQEWLSKGEKDEDYVFPQYVAAFCQAQGFDGIGYRSKYASRTNARNKQGINYTIFNYPKCQVTGSKLKRVGKVSVQISDY